MQLHVLVHESHPALVFGDTGPLDESCGPLDFHLPHPAVLQAVFCEPQPHENVLNVGALYGVFLAELLHHVLVAAHFDLQRAVAGRQLLNLQPVPLALRSAEAYVGAEVCDMLFQFEVAFLEQLHFDFAVVTRDCGGLFAPWLLPPARELEFQMLDFDQSLAVHDVELVVVFLRSTPPTQKMYKSGDLCESRLISLCVDVSKSQSVIEINRHYQSSSRKRSVSASFSPISMESLSKCGLRSPAALLIKSAMSFLTFFFSMTFYFPNSRESGSEMSSFLVSNLLVSISLARLIESPIEARTGLLALGFGLNASDSLRKHDEFDSSLKAGVVVCDSGSFSLLRLKTSRISTIFFLRSCLSKSPIRSRNSRFFFYSRDNLFSIIFVSDSCLPNLC